MGAGNPAPNPLYETPNVGVMEHLYQHTYCFAYQSCLLGAWGTAWFFIRKMPGCTLGELVEVVGRLPPHPSLMVGGLIKDPLMCRGMCIRMAAHARHHKYMLICPRINCYRCHEHTPPELEDGGVGQHGLGVLALPP